MKKTSGATDISNGWNIVLNIITAAYTLICLLPFLLVVIVSFTDETEVVRNGYSYIPRTLSLEA